MNMTARSIHLTAVLLIRFPVLLIASNDCINFDSFATCSDIVHVTSLPPKIETLVLTGGSLKTLPGSFFSHLPQLTELNIQNTHIGVINSNAFSQLPRLDLLLISKSNISIIETGAFRGLRGLTSLDISESRIDAIEVEAFSDMDNIQEFTIKTSTVSFIDSRAFWNISTVRNFQLYENNVSVVKAGAFSAWNGLLTAVVNSNTFTRLECMSGTGLTNAASFSFYRNYLECGCHLAWMLTSPYLSDQLLSNMCQVPGTDESLSMTSVSITDLQCPDNATAEQKGCSHTPEVTTGVTATTTDSERGWTASANPQTTQHQSHSTETVTHFTHSPFMVSTTLGDVTSATALPGFPSDTSGQSSTGGLETVSIFTLLALVTLPWLL